MAIDHVIDLDCVPKQMLTTDGILARLKARDRAAAILKLYRDRGDQRPPSEMGFEMARRLPDGSEETRVIIVQEMLDQAAQLDPLAKHCEGCPANRSRQPFGCFGMIGYPISQAAELWLLKQLPDPDDPLIFLLLNKTMTDFAFNDENVAAMRARPGIFFETGERFAKQLEDTQITTDQVFEMLFLTQTIQPAHGALLLAFFDAIPRDMDAAALMALTEGQPATSAGRDMPFLLKFEPPDDESITALKQFFEAMYVAFRLDMTLSLDV